MNNFMEILVGILGNITNLISNIQIGLTTLVTSVTSIAYTGLRKAYTTAKTLLIIGLSGLTLAAGLLYWGYIFQSTIMLQVGGILAAAMCFIVWLIPSAFNWLIKNTLATAPEGYGEYFNKLSDGIKSLSAFLINIAFLLTIIAVVAGSIVNLPLTNLLGIIAFSMGVFFLSILVSAKYPIWRTALMTAAVITLFFQSYTLVAPVDAEDTKDDVVTIFIGKDYVVKKNATIYKLVGQNNQPEAIDTLKEEAVGRLIEIITDPVTKQKLLLLSLEREPGNFVGGRQIIISKGSAKKYTAPDNPDFKQVNAKQEVKTDVQPVNNQPKHQSVSKPQINTQTIHFQAGDNPWSEILFLNDESFTVTELTGTISLWHKKNAGLKPLIQGKRYTVKVVENNDGVKNAPVHFIAQTSGTITIQKD